MRVEIIADHEEDVLSFGLGRFRRNQRRDAWSVDFGFLQVPLARNPLVGTILNVQVPFGVESFSLRSKFFGGEGRQPALDLGELIFSGQVIPFVGVPFDVIEFLAVLSVKHIAPITVDDGIFSGMHMGKKNGAVLSLVRIGQSGGDGSSFQFLFGLRKSAHFLEGGIHIDQAYGDIRNFVFGHARPGPDKGNIGSPFPEGVFSPVPFFSKVVAMITPENDDGIVRVGAFL